MTSRPKRTKGMPTVSQGWVCSFDPLWILNGDIHVESSKFMTILHPDDHPNFIQMPTRISYLRWLGKFHWQVVEQQDSRSHAQENVTFFSRIQVAAGKGPARYLTGSSQKNICQNHTGSQAHHNHTKTLPLLYRIWIHGPARWTLGKQSMVMVRPFTGMWALEIGVHQSIYHSNIYYVSPAGSSKHKLIKQQGRKKHRIMHPIWIWR